MIKIRKNTSMNGAQTKAGGGEPRFSSDVVTIGGGEPLTPNGWRYLLDSVGLLFWDQRLAYALRTIASLVMIASLVFGGWLLLKN